jgi:hypothetical protein
MAQMGADLRRSDHRNLGRNRNLNRIWFVDVAGRGLTTVARRYGGALGYFWSVAPICLLRLGLYKISAMRNFAGTFVILGAMAFVWVLTAFARRNGVRRTEAGIEEVRCPHCKRPRPLTPWWHPFGTAVPSDPEGISRSPQVRELWGHLRF